MTNNITLTKNNASSENRILNWSGRAWILSAILGQLGFIVFIAMFYGLRIFSGDFAGWNDKPIIDGYIQGDTTGNYMFAIHVLFAAVMTLSGVIQLIPKIRARLPFVHRVSGRIFLSTGCLLAIGGLWMTWVRGTHMHISGAYAISIDALLILVFAVLTVKFAIRRNIKVHQRWAMRFFMVASAVWFLRVAMMGWMIIAQGPVGMTQDMSGPTDFVMMFGCYLIPLAIYELYKFAEASSFSWIKVATASLVFIATGFTILGVFGSIAYMWWPYL